MSAGAETPLDASVPEDGARLYTDERLGEEYFWKKTFINSGAKKETGLECRNPVGGSPCALRPPFPAYNLIQSFRQGG